MEEVTTGCANVIVVNSKFTSDQFREAFQYLGKYCTPEVLYPTVKDTPANPKDVSDDVIAYTKGFDRIFVSLNR